MLLNSAKMLFFSFGMNYLSPIGGWIYFSNWFFELIFDWKALTKHTNIYTMKTTSERTELLDKYTRLKWRLICCFGPISNFTVSSELIDEILWSLSDKIIEIEKFMGRKDSIIIARYLT